MKKYSLIWVIKQYYINIENAISHKNIFFLFPLFKIESAKGIRIKR